jgi:hypothetical protein
MRCEESGDMKMHLSEQLRLRESLAGMGASMDDQDFYAIILGSLPESYRPLVSSINAAARIAQKPLTPSELIGVISEEYEHRIITNNRGNKRGGNAALTAKTSNERAHRPNNSMQNQDITCYNCDRKGHYKSDCWRPGGGKEGQGPQQKRGKGGQTNNHAADAAAAGPETQGNYAFATSDMTNVANQLNIPVKHQGAILDSGATSHFCPDQDKFQNLVTIKPQDIYMADGD